MWWIQKSCSYADIIYPHLQFMCRTSIPYIIPFYICPFDLSIYGSDASDAFAHSPGPYVPNFVSIDEQFSDWYRYRFGNNVDSDKVLSVLIPLQGHPESSRLWGSLINQTLKRMGFSTTTHDRIIFRYF